MKSYLKLILFIICVLTNITYIEAAKGDPDYWYYSHALVKTEPTGAGKVYANSDATKTANTSNCVDAPHTFSDRTHQSNLPYKWYLNTIPTDSKKYKFVHWTDAQGNVLSTDQNPQTHFDDNVCIKGGGNNKGLKADEGDETIPPSMDSISITFIAVYEEILNQYVSVESQNPDYLTATIDKPENQIGDEVTLWAYPNNYDTKFTGWVKDGVVVTTDNPYTFTITSDNAGTYTATYRTGHNFFRLRNKNTGRIINGISDSGSLTDFSSLQLVNGPTSVYSAGSVVEISCHHISGGTPYNFRIQGYNSNTGLNESAGEYITMALSSEDNTWTIRANRQPAFMADENQDHVTVYGAGDDDIAHWYVDCIDKDLETCENYFSLDPAKLVQVGDKYYTTLRTSWNILFNPEQMTPYIVSSYDETAGTFEMEPLTGNIIPAGTPVVIETSSADVEENRMVPTTTAAASGAVPSGNQLVCSTKYFPNQSAPTSPCKGLTVSNGKLTFGGSNLSTVNGNEAYLPVASDVSLEPEIPEIPEVTLAELLASGDTENTYIVTDLTAVRLVDNDQLLIAKDDDGYATPDENTGSDADYMQYASGLQHPMGLRAYDQSNWIALRVPAGDNISASVLGKHLTGVKGRLLSTVNPEFQLDVAPGSDDATAANVTPNTFVAASFQGSQDGFFFVQPKPMEIAYVEWAQWNGTKFIAPVHDENHPDWNQAELTGEFELNGAYLESQNENGGSLDMSTLVSGHVYAMEPAVIKVKTVDYPHVYVLGNVNGTNGNTNNGVEMSTNDGVTYTAIVNVNNSDNGYGYFCFTKKLGEDRNAIKDYLFGPEAEGSYWGVNNEHYNTALTLRYWGYDTRSFRIPAGTYSLTVTLKDGEYYYAGNVVIRTVPAQAPRREAASKQYVVYPLSMTQITSEENGVVTGVSTVGGDRVAVSRQYVNVAGVRASQPWNGVNIVITTYSDGTTTATKQLH